MYLPDGWMGGWVGRLMDGQMNKGITEHREGLYYVYQFRVAHTVETFFYHCSHHKKSCTLYCLFSANTIGHFIISLNQKPHHRRHSCLTDKETET